MTDQPEMSPLTEPEREWVRVRRDFAAQEGVDHLDLDAVAAYYDAVLARSQAEAEELDPRSWRCCWTSSRCCSASTWARATACSG